MRALVVYESEFGATRRIAEAIASGLESHVRTKLWNVRELPLAESAWKPEPGDLLVVGSPTHARSMPRPLTRTTAASWPEKPGSTLTLEPRALANGVREWLSEVELNDVSVAAFATRATIPRILSGSAAAAISRLARHRGARSFTRPRSFLVQPEGGVTEDEFVAARIWGRALAVKLTTRWEPV